MVASRTQQSGRWFICVAVITWLFALGVGLHLLWQYKSAPGQAAQAPLTWPRKSRIARVANKPTLLMFAHPRCVCTDASLHELARLLRAHRNRVNAHVLFTQLAARDASWSSTDSIRAARRIAGLHVQLDALGREAALFGSATSGQVLLYDRGSALRFQGGITRARGHRGDSEGLLRLTHLLQGLPVVRADSPVFGCELTEPRLP